MRKPTSSAITSGGLAMCESFSPIIQTGNFGTACAKFWRKFTKQWRDDGVAHTPGKPKAGRGLTALQSTSCETRPETQLLSRSFRSACASSRRFSEERSSILDSSTQKSSGTFIPSVLNEYTDFTKPDRALVSNQGAEHHGY